MYHIKLGLYTIIFKSCGNNSENSCVQSQLDDDLAKWDDIGPGYCEETARCWDAQDFYDSLNDSDRRMVVIMSDGTE